MQLHRALRCKFVLVLQRTSEKGDSSLEMVRCGSGQMEGAIAQRANLSANAPLQYTWAPEPSQAQASFLLEAGTQTREGS